MNAKDRDFLSPEVISRISSLDLIARFVVEGFITGLHQSPYHGFSAEFAEHRQYIAGDPLRYMDWKVYGRSDRLYIKRFEEETNLIAHLIVDVSGSMGFRDRGFVTKYRYAAVIASALAHLMIRQRDSVGLVTFSDTLRTYIRPRSVQSHVHEIIRALSPTEPAGRTVTGDILDTLAERISGRGLIILISDLILDDKELLRGLRHFRYNGHEVLVFHIMDPMERDFDYSSDVRFVDMETEENITTQPWHIRDTYRSMQDERLSSLQHAMHDISVDYSLFTTDVPFDRALSSYLAKRKRLF